MIPPGNICWLSSYPKSGNTWLRALLTNYFSGADHPASINELAMSPFGVRRELFESLLGLETSDMLEEELASVRPAVYRRVSKQADKTIFCKIHDAYSRTPCGELMFPPEATLASIYLARNPLDVAVSFAHHQGWSLKATVQAMGNDDFGLAVPRDSLDHQIPQRLGSWSSHVLGWVDQTNSPVLVLRYEDMLDDPRACLTRVLSFLDLPICGSRVEKAVEFSSFRELQRQEQKSAFLEKNPAASHFFRKGVSGNWREELPEYLIKEIRERHTAVMRRFGYL